MARTADEIPDSTLRLLTATGVGPRTVAALRHAFDDDDDAVTCATIDELRHVRGVGNERARAIRAALDAADIERQRAAMRAVAATVILPGDDDYPPLLDTIIDPPLGLFTRGEITIDDRLAIAIVGSRDCTVYGREQARRFGAALAQSGLTIVSGGAIGIDGAAHRGAILGGGRTIAVLGSGVDVLYPVRHNDLFHQIIEGNGAVVSECPMGTEPRPGNFPRRNRILSGMSLGVLVVEAALRSGALITARLAAEEHCRDVLMIPGRVDSPASAGCLHALREGWGTIVRNHGDVLESMESARFLIRGAMEQRAAHARRDQAAADTDSESPTDVPSLFELNVTDAQKAIIAMLWQEGRTRTADVEQLGASLSLPVAQLLAELTVLELRGLIGKDRNGITLSARGIRLAQSLAPRTGL